MRNLKETRMTSRFDRRATLKTLATPLALAVGAAVPRVYAQAAKDVKVGLLVPLSGLYARPGTVMRMGAEMAIDHINAAGGVKALGGAKLSLVVIDSGDSTEKAKNSAQRMVSQEPDMVAASGAYLSSFTLAVTEVTERAKLPMLTLSYSDLITSRGFKYVFQTSATAAAQAEMSLPVVMKLAEAAGKRPKTVAIITDNTGASVASVKPMRERLLKELGLQLVVDETWTPPLADATPLIQKVRTARPDLLFALPTAVSDAKLLLEKLNEFGLGQGKLPTIGFGIVMAEPDMLKTMDASQLDGLMLAVGSWGAKGHEKLIEELKTRYKEPWMTQNAISTYADMWVIKEALEHAGKADREEVAVALRKIDGGPSKYYPGGRIKFDDNGRRVEAGLTIIQWQKGTPITVYPPELAVAPPVWGR
jgi:branched-chain amino acid transport system substrate-binding protein